MYVTRSDVIYLGCTSALDIHLCELMPTRHTWLAILASIYGGEAMGKLLPYLLGLALLGDKNGGSLWRYFLLILSIPSILFIGLACKFLDDTPVFLQSKKKPEEAMKVLAKITAKDAEWSLNDINNGASNDNETHEEHQSTRCVGSWRELKFITENRYILQSLICVTLIGFSVKYTTYELSYIVTELIFLSGQTESNYCSGTKDNTYYLQSYDYLLLSGYMIAAFIVKVLSLILANRLKLSLRKSGRVCLGVSLLLAAFLYSCPEYWIALIIYALIDASSAVIELYNLIVISELVPTSVRSTMYGLMTFIMYIPLASTPYLVQVLTKRSQHYLTTTTMSFITISFIAVLSLPENGT